MRVEMSCDWLAEVAIRGTTFFANDGASEPALHISEYASGCTGLPGLAPVVIENSILWGNTLGDVAGGVQANLSGAPGATVRWTTVEGGTAGIASTALLFFGPSVLDQDPLFAAPASGNVHLSALSPCIDGGDPAYVPLEGEADMDGQARVVGPAIDMGADEVQP